MADKYHIVKATKEEIKCGFYVFLSFFFYYLVEGLILSSMFVDKKEK